MNDYELYNLETTARNLETYLWDVWKVQRDVEHSDKCDDWDNAKAIEYHAKKVESAIENINALCKVLKEYVVD